MQSRAAGWEKYLKGRNVSTIIPVCFLFLSFTQRFKERVKAINVDHPAQRRRPGPGPLQSIVEPGSSQTFIFGRFYAE
jgi:hypothetical protein